MPRALRVPTSAGVIGLSLLAGFGVVVAGWDLAGHFGRSSAGEVLFEARGGLPDPVTDSGWTIALIFTPMECPGLMSVVDRLNDLDLSRLSVRGLLVVDQRRFADWKDLLVANQIRFPVRPVTPGKGRQTLEQLGDLRTPVVAVFDRHRELRLVSNLADQDRLIDLIRDAVQSDSRR